MMDSALNNPLECFVSKTHDKTVGKENVTVKQEYQETKVKCDQCEKICLNMKGYRIHVGRVHTVKLDSYIKRKRSESRESCKDDTICDACDLHCESNNSLKIHKSVCTKTQMNFHKSRQFTPANKKINEKGWP